MGTFISWVVVASLGALLLARVPFVPESDVGWYVLFGLPLAGVGVAMCIGALSNRRAFRVLAGMVVTGAGVIQTAFGMLYGLLDPDNHWGRPGDPRPWSVGLGLVLACIGVYLLFRRSRNS
jgi:hypothetical protein